VIFYEDFFRWLFLDGAMQSVQSPSSPSVFRESMHPFTAAFQMPTPERAQAVSRLLLEQPEVASTVNAKGSLPIHLALRSRQPLEVLRLLVQAYPQGAQAQDEFGSLPLHLALSGDGASSEIAFELLRLHPEGARTADPVNSMLPIHLALMLDRSAPILRLVQALLEAHVHGSIAKAPSGDRPIHLAVYLDHGPDVMEEILKAAWKCHQQQK